MAQLANLPCNVGIPNGCSSCPVCSNSHLTPYLLPGNKDSGCDKKGSRCPKGNNSGKIFLYCK